MHTYFLIVLLSGHFRFGSLLNVRLLSSDGSAGNHKGYLQFDFHRGWKYLCDQYWDNRNSKVVCRQLGFAKAVYRNKTSHDSAHQSEFHHLMVHCEGNEKSLAQCPLKHVESYVFNKKCHHSSQVFIYCSETRDNDIAVSPNKKFELRLWNNSSKLKKPNLRGDLQYFNGNSWINVCSSGWNDQNSFVACSTLGYTKHESSSKDLNPHASSEDPFFNCSGEETSLWDCSFSLKQLGSCENQQPIKLICKTKVEYLRNQIRLRGGFREGEGRVEIFNGTVWGTICDDGWDLVDASVVCKELGFGSATEASHWADHGEGLDAILATDIQCSGSERYLHQCVRSKNTSMCSHSEDAGVRCNVPHIIYEDVRLIGGVSNFEGRVEVTFDGSTWGGICGIGFSELEGKVVCRQLSLGYVSWASKSYKYGINYKKLMYNVKCLGNENSIKDCSYKSYSACRYYDMASVICTKNVPDLVMDISTFEQSIKVESHIMSQLKCSFEEKCLSPIVDKSFFSNKALTRKLLKFTSRFLNKGTVAFRPNVHKENWKWHKCHQHYHSQETFAVYDLIDQDGHAVSEGHKASFCLEDSDCEPGYQQVFNCTDKNDQGVSVNCADNYKNTLDCQWIDITEVSEGNYSLRVFVNPLELVMESDHFNNRAVCVVHYYNNVVEVKQCSAEPCYQESFGGNSYGHCCHFPFTYQGQLHYDCISTDHKNKLWCGTTPNVDKDGKWGYCKLQI